jgi:hypothetical protein
MRSQTILGLMSQAGVATAAVAAKDKLRRMLNLGLDGVCFSSECADAEAQTLVGRPRPDMYSADLSLFVLDAGLRLLTPVRCGSSICRSPITSSMAMPRAIPRPTCSTMSSINGWRALSNWAPLWH